MTDERPSLPDDAKREILAAIAGHADPGQRRPGL